MGVPKLREKHYIIPYTEVDRDGVSLLPSWPKVKGRILIFSFHNVKIKDSELNGPKIISMPFFVFRNQKTTFL